MERLDAVFSYDGDVTSTIAACLANINEGQKIYAVGYGSLQDFAEQLRDGTLDGLVTQNDTNAASLAAR